MSHDANTVLLGTTRSNIKEVGNHVGVIAAGKVVRLKSDGTISTASADGLPMGISLGGDLTASPATHTAVAYSGIEVPLLVTAAFTPVLGTIVYIDNVTGIAAASSTGATAVNATYRTSLLSDGAISEDGLSSPAACLVNFPIGL